MRENDADGPIQQEADSVCSYGPERDDSSRFSIRWFHASDGPLEVFSDFGLRASFGLRVSVFGFQGHRHAFTPD
jgi:hypothetical protein